MDGQKPSFPSASAPIWMLCDCHMAENASGHHEYSIMKLTLEKRFDAGKKFKVCLYQVNSWNVFLLWPFTWKAPGPNKLGWLPKYEFGDPHSADCAGAVRTDISWPVAPFQYKAIDGNLYTPTSPAEKPE